MEGLPKTVLKDGYLTSPVESPVEEEKAEEEEEPFAAKLLARVEQHLKVSGDREILINAELVLEEQDQDESGKRSLWLSEVGPLSQGMAKALHHLGVSSGDFVHCSLYNTAHFHIPTIGAWLCGAKVSLSNPSLVEPVLAQQLKDTEAKVVFCHRSNLHVVEGALASLGWLGVTRVIIVDPGSTVEDKSKHIYSLEALLRESQDLEEVPPAVAEGDTVLWSSGTTGRPKGIPHNAKRFQTFESGHFRHLDGLLVITGFFHNSGFLLSLDAIFNGFPCVFFCNKDKVLLAEKILLAVDRFRCSVLFAVAHQIMALADTAPAPAGDLSSVVAVFPMGTNLPHDPYEDLRRHFPGLKAVVNVYTLTEFGGTATVSLTAQNLGNVFPGTTLKIVDPVTGQLCGPNEVGEIRGKCDQMTRGYLNNPEETAKLYDEEGFMRFGDLGHYDDDLVMHFDSRLQEVILCQGHCLYPTEIEEVLMQHPGVRDAAVFGRPDPLLTQLVTAVVVKKPAAPGLTEEELVEFVARQVPDYKRLRGGVAFVEELPRSVLGKLVRGELRR